MVSCIAFNTIHCLVIRGLRYFLMANMNSSSGYSKNKF